MSRGMEAKMKNIVIAFMLLGCTNAGVTQSFVEEGPCGPDEGMVVVDGEVVQGITQCALCARFESAYEARAEELDCAQPFPREACVDEGLADCYIPLIDEWADFDWALDCESLYAYAAQPETYHDFVCGDSCETTGTHNFECCEGTPYHLRGPYECPYWCWGVSECNANAECLALFESL